MYVTPEERKANGERPADNVAVYNNEEEKFHFSRMFAVFKDIRTYLFFFIHGTAVLGVSVVGSFLPTFIRGFGYSPRKSRGGQKL